MKAPPPGGLAVYIQVYKRAESDERSGRACVCRQRTTQEPPRRRRRPHRGYNDSDESVEEEDPLLAILGAVDEELADDGPGATCAHARMQRAHVSGSVVDTHLDADAAQGHPHIVMPERAELSWHLAPPRAIRIRSHCGNDSGPLSGVAVSEGAASYASVVGRSFFT